VALTIRISPLDSQVFDIVLIPAAMEISRLARSMWVWAVRVKIHTSREYFESYSFFCDLAPVGFRFAKPVQSKGYVSGWRRESGTRVRKPWFAALRQTIFCL